MSETALARTPLHDLHVELGGRMVPFAGYEMPVQYPMGIMKEHLYTPRGGRPVRCFAHGPSPASSGSRRGGGARSAWCRSM